MKTYIVEIDVDEKKVKKMAGIKDLMEAIETELGWVHESGIYVVELRKKEKIKL